MKKITLATVKSFIRRNVGKGLLVHTLSRFAMMTDSVGPITYGEWLGHRPVNEIDFTKDIEYWIPGASFVRDSCDYFEVIDTPEWSGYRVSNCCGKFELVIPVDNA